MKFLSVVLLVMLFSSFNGGCAQKKHNCKKNMDKNGDGVVSHREYKHSQHHYHKADKNRDGYVTRNEFPGPNHRFNQMDRNNDGVLTGRELP